VVGFKLANKIPANGPPIANLTGAQSFVLGYRASSTRATQQSGVEGWARLLRRLCTGFLESLPKLTLDFGGRVDVDAEPSRSTQTHISLLASDSPGHLFSDQKTVIEVAQASSGAD
jgi:hypothetical protein